VDGRVERALRADGRRNRERVLVAAQQLFAEQGLAVPIDAIARRAGVGPGTVYRHFSSKEELFAAAVAHRTDRLLARAEDRAASEEPGPAFFGFLGDLFEDVDIKRDLAAAVGGRTGDQPRDQRLREAIGLLLARAQSSGAVRDDIDLVDLLALLQGAYAAALSEGTDAERRTRIHRVLFQGLRPPAPQGPSDLPPRDADPR
jgi:AcrR family transcriptional regulator